MEIITLDQQHPEFSIRGREEKMNAEILKVVLTGPLPEPPLLLEVLDENGMLLYSRPLIPKPQLPDEVPLKEFPEVPVNKRFIFNAELFIRIVARPGVPFQAKVQFV